MNSAGGRGGSRDRDPPQSIRQSSSSPRLAVRERPGGEPPALAVNVETTMRAGAQPKQFPAAGPPPHCRRGRVDPDRLRVLRGLRPCFAGGARPKRSASPAQRGNGAEQEGRQTKKRGSGRGSAAYFSLYPGEDGSLAGRLCAGPCQAVGILLTSCRLDVNDIDTKVACYHDGASRRGRRALRSRRPCAMRSVLTRRDGDDDGFCKPRGAPGASVRAAPQPAFASADLAFAIAGSSPCSPSSSSAQPQRDPGQTISQNSRPPRSSGAASAARCCRITASSGADHRCVSRTGHREIRIFDKEARSSPRPCRRGRHRVDQSAEACYHCHAPASAAQIPAQAPPHLPLAVGIGFSAPSTSSATSQPARPPTATLTRSRDGARRARRRLFARRLHTSERSDIMTVAASRPRWRS